MKVLAFDVFGTIVKLDGVPREEIKAYVDHIRKPTWTPLELPRSWETLPAFDDVAENILRLRVAGYFCVTCSNAPLGLQAKLMSYNGISFDALIPLEMCKAYKTNPRCYWLVCDVLGVKPEDVTMITGNKTFGDIEASRSIGMNAMLIRQPDGLNGMNDLAKALRERDYP